MPEDSKNPIKKEPVNQTSRRPWSVLRRNRRSSEIGMFSCSVVEKRGER